MAFSNPLSENAVNEAQYVEFGENKDDTVNLDLTTAYDTNAHENPTYDTGSGYKYDQ